MEQFPVCHWRCFFLQPELAGVKKSKGKGGGGGAGGWAGNDRRGPGPGPGPGGGGGGGDGRTRRVAGMRNVTTINPCKGVLLQPPMSAPAFHHHLISAGSPRIMLNLNQEAHTLLTQSPTLSLDHFPVTHMPRACSKTPSLVALSGNACSPGLVPARHVCYLSVCSGMPGGG